ncbi:MAG: SurA N-terminal domain-containing protein [Acidobacteriota bacterium]|nr:SurA N-terminal domain-containing protein [Acidobacteriota bacterium]
MHMARLSAIVVLAASLAFGCGNAPSAAQSPSPPPISPAAGGGADPVVAEIGGRQITLSEVDAKWQEFDAAERARLTQLLYQNRRNMLELLVGDVLIADAAKAVDMSVEAFTEREVGKRIQTVSDAEIRQFYEQNKERSQGRTLEELRQPIVDFLQSQRQAQARAQLVDDLRGKAANVRVLLDPPRVQVAVAADDPVRGGPTAAVTLVEYSDYQ